MLGYFLLLGLFLMLLLLCFFFGVREWLRPQDDLPLPADVEYVRSENYLGAAFRCKMRQWMQSALPLTEASTDGHVRAVLEKPGGERIHLLAGGCVPSREFDELIYCEGDFVIPQNAVFHREIYGAANVHSGAGAKLQAIAADGHIVLGFDNEVARWVDSRRTIFLGRGTVVHSRVSAAISIELAPQVAVQSLYAPLIFTPGYASLSEFATTTAPQTNPPSTLPSELKIKEDIPARLKDSSATHLTPRTWQVRGDLELHDGECVEGNLIVQGTLRSGSGCRFGGSVKAGVVEFGPFNTVDGNLVSDGPLTIGECSRVGCNVIAEKAIFLLAGVRVGAKNHQAAISSGGEIIMENNVAVCGKIAAARNVVTR